MRRSKDPYEADFNCPWCGARLSVDDSADFETCDQWSREETYVGTCPACDGEFEFIVCWEPTYPCEPKKVGE